MADADLPLWQLDSIYPGLDAPEIENDRRTLRQSLDALEALMDASGVRAVAAGGRTEAPKDTLDAGLEALERIGSLFATVRTYLNLRLAVATDDEDARVALTALDPAAARLDTLRGRWLAWVGDLELEAEDLGPRARDHLYLLRRARAQAEHLMGEEAEALAAALDSSGATAWSRLHGELVGGSAVTATMPPEGRPHGYGLAQLRVLQADPSEATRRTAFHAELELLRTHAPAFAAAMNGIKGQVGELARRRGWADPLEEALFANAIDNATLEALQQASEAHIPSLRRYLGAKARLLNKPSLAWYDLFAPLPQAGARAFSWGDATRVVVDRFARFSPALASFATSAFERGWIDAPPRPGKRNGAFCAPVHGRRESRVMLNFGGRLDDVFTLAHELGHAYHNDCLYRHGRGVLRSRTPMALAETASIFCETLVLDGLLTEADEREQLAILEQDLQSTAQLVIDIRSRFRFERAVFELRSERALSVSELDTLMLDAQAEAYGDALDAGARHPMMWALKPHYYSGGRSFYNFPYTFGLLFGLGLFRVYQADPTAFVPLYDELLASTGSADAAELAARFDIDIRDPAFWHGGLAIADARVERFLELTEGMQT